MKEPNEIASEYAGSRLDQMRFILVLLFLVEQRWRYIIDKEMAEANLTTKQWLMLIVIGNGLKYAPSIREVAAQLSTTHQNVKQIASSLKNRGFIAMERDPQNRRIIRLIMTDRCREFFENRPQDVTYISELFTGLTDSEVEALFHIISKMERTADSLYEKAKKPAGLK